MAILKQTTLAAQGVTGLIRKSWRKQIEDQKVMGDVMVAGLAAGNQGVHYLGLTEESKTPSLVANKVLTDFTPDLGDEKAYSDSLTITLSMPLSSAGHEGDDTAIGTEEVFTWKEGVLYSNDIGKAVSLREYGVYQRQQIPLNIRPKVNTKLGVWKNQWIGLSMREALLETYCSNLTKAPRSLTQVWSSNFWIPGLAAASQPVYDSTDADYVTAVETAFATLQADDATKAILSLSNMLDMIEIAKGKYIKPILFGDQYLYVLYVHPTAVRWLKNSGNTGSIQEYVVSVQALNQNPIKDILPGSKWIVDNKLLIIEDDLCPVLKAVRATDAVTSYYVSYGRTDSRPTTAAAGSDIYAANMLVGEGALGKLTSGQWTFDEEIEDYGKYKGLDFHGVESYQQIKYDLDAGSKTDTSLVQEGSMIVPSFIAAGA